MVAGLKERFNNLSIAKQLQLTFVISIALFCSMIIIITKLQLDWLHAATQSYSSALFKETILTKMKVLAQAEGLFLKQQFSRYANIVSTLEGFNGLALENSETLFQLSLKPIKSDQVPTDYFSTKRSTYFTMSHQLSDLSNKTLYNIAQYDQVIQFLYENSYLNLYEGFAADEILNFYPGSYFSRHYTPVVREWYYKAISASNQLIITEPYEDAITKNWIITVSKGIVDKSNKKVGVAAVDITLIEIQKHFSSISILDSGFILLVSASGMIISMPEAWKTEVTYRIYDSKYTAINIEFWEDIKSLHVDSNFEYTDINGTEYLGISYPIAAIENSEAISHYLILLVNKKELLYPNRLLKEKYSQMYGFLFWTILGIAVCTFSVSLVLVFYISSELAKNLKRINEVLIEIIRGALFANHIDRINFGAEINEKIISIGVNLIKKVEKIECKEDLYYHHRWGSTRPQEKMKFNSWEKVIYPFNYMHEKKMDSRIAIQSIERHLYMYSTKYDY